jgi:small-conductance mechanosensitive channel
MRTINAVITCMLEQDEIEDLQELSTGEVSEKQRQLTYLSVGRRVVLFVVVLFAAGMIVSQFGSLQRFGVSLVASAGVLTILLGIAAQPVLGNFIASIQIALAKPVRIGDSVYYDGTWGYVEDITYTYILIKAWDKRRLVVPLRYFVTHPFENWTKRDAHLIKPIYFHADYSIDVDAVRKKFVEFLEASDLWDGEEEPNLIVYESQDETLRLRALCSASNPSDAWTLHCELREKLVGFVRDLEGGKHLPRRRLVMTDETGSDSSRTDSPYEEEKGDES